MDTLKNVLGLTCRVYERLGVPDLKLPAERVESRDINSRLFVYRTQVKQIVSLIEIFYDYIAKEWSAASVTITIYDTSTIGIGIASL